MPALDGNRMSCCAAHNRKGAPLFQSHLSFNLIKKEWIAIASVSLCHIVWWQLCQMNDSSAGCRWNARWTERTYPHQIVIIKWDPLIRKCCVMWGKSFLKLIFTVTQSLSCIQISLFCFCLTYTCCWHGRFVWCTDVCKIVLRVLFVCGAAVSLCICFHCERPKDCTWKWASS